MKILFVANYAKEHINKFHLSTIKDLIDKGCQVDVACNLDDNVPYCNNAFDLKCERNPFSIKSIKAIKTLNKIIKDNNYDVVFCHTLCGRFIGTMAYKKIRNNNCKLVFTYHGLNFFKGSSLLSKLFIPFEKKLSKYLYMGFCNNEEDYIFLKKIGVNRLYKCYPIFNSEKFNTVNFNDNIKVEKRKSLGLNGNDIVLIYVAELTKNKNQILLLNVLSKLIKINDKYKLLLVGPNHSNNYILKMVNQLNLSSNVRLLGWRDDVAELLMISDIYVASSIREGFGVNLLEAEYCKLPIVATNNRGHREIINNDENGYLCDIDDIDGMLDLINKISTNREIKEKFIANGMKKLAYIDEHRMDKCVVEHILSVNYDE